ncbi:MAG: primosomal protein N' [Oligoflexia bacterium]|nr:primosomal protein N' [Oligoflexia bacterium]
MYYKIAVNTPFNNSILTYSSNSKYESGQLVYVPLGKRKEKGCVLGEDSNVDSSVEIKEILESYELDIVLKERYLEFLGWVARYYHYPLGQLIFDVLPKLLKRPREITPFYGKSTGAEFVLNEYQQEVWNKLSEQIDGFSKSLIHGVTGSGKSVLYLKLIKEKLKDGSVLYLLPEINLTPQFVNFFEEYLDVKIYTYNSTVSNSEKLALWKTLSETQENVFILGVRSSVFLPIDNLSLIIVDEEHDSSFKQDDRCPYNARDIAIKNASLMNIPIVLGTATPALETYYKYKKTNTYYPLSVRANNSKLPEIELVNTRNIEYNEDIWPFAPETIAKVRERIMKKEQVLIFVNRLGFASYVQCHACGKEFHCPNCSTVLKYYKARRTLECQFCEFQDKFPEECPDCGNMKLIHKGYGTEKLQEVLSRIFPEVSMTRFDRDNVKTANKLEEVLNDFHSGKYQLLIGTQMLSKGHNFEKVNCVVILGVDNQLNFPDFRSSERVYQLATQVAGRSGRYTDSGEVIIQTHNPDNNLFQFIKAHSFDEFLDEELKMREVCEFPPYSNLIMIHLTSKFQHEVINEANKVKSFYENVKEHFPNVDFLGPRPAVIEKRANKFTWSILLKSNHINELHNLINSIKTNLKFHYSISLKIDIDPQNIL